MRSFRAKLADLSGTPPRAAEVIASPRPEPDEEPLSAPIAAPVPAAPPTIEALRARMAAILATSAPPPPKADPAATELPFVEEQTPFGKRYIRRSIVGPGARVGRYPLWPAASADPEMLALLALDPALAACDPRRALYLDTETTGLGAGAGTVAFLVGLAFFEEGRGLVLEQMLLRKLGEEAPILEQLGKRLAVASMWVTFNGKSFDAPVVRARFVMNRMPFPPEKPHLDLLHVARRIHGHRLTSCSLAAIENDVLGRVRVGDIGGLDIVAAYGHFLRTGDEATLAAVVTHNEHDVLSMVALCGMYGEPLTALGPTDLAGAAATVGRSARAAKTNPTAAGARARALADEAVRRGGGSHARRVRGDLHRASGDRAAALADYEAIVKEVDDPSARLVLAKLYEHHQKAYSEALALVDRGTGEAPAFAEKRRARLLRKLG